MKIGKYDIPLFANFETLERCELDGGKAIRQVYFSDGIPLVKNTVKEAVVMPKHSHPHEQLTYVSEGECDVVIGEEQQTLTSGGVCMLPPNVEHSVVCKRGTVIWDVFTPLREDLIASVLD